MNGKPSTSSPPASTIPPDDLNRKLALARPNEDQALPHVGVAGDTYTILLTGKDTAGRYCLIDMHVPPGGGPPPHRHEFEEMFTVLEGEIEATFRGQKSVVRAGETLTSRPMRRTPSTTEATGRRGCCACVRRLGWKSFSWLLVCRSRAGRLRLPNSTRRPQRR